MSAQKTWPSILSMLTFETRLFALIALVAEVALLSVIPWLPDAQRIWAFIVVVALLVVIVVASIRSVSKAKSHDHFPILNLKVRQMREILVQDDFIPQLIVAIPRGGLAVAGMLARQLGGDRVIPVITLTPRGRPDGFRNAFNPITLTRSDLAGHGSGTAAKVLIVDDISRSGRTLQEALEYLQAELGGDEFVVRTAALSFYAKTDAVAPSYFVDKLNDPIRDASGELESWPERR